MAEFPEMIGLSVGETDQFTYSSGTWTLHLTSYSEVTHRERIEVTVRVTGPNSYDESHTARVSMGQSDFVLGGLRIFPFAWKEADDTGGGLEPVGQQGSLPVGLNSGTNDIAFLINDAADGLFPAGSYMYSEKPWTGQHFQNYLETDGWAHSGHDVPMPGGTWFVAPYDGWIFGALGGQMVFVPNLSPNDGWSPGAGNNAGSSSWSQAPVTIIQTHTSDSSAVHSNGTWVTAGTQCVQSNNVDRHFHAGSKGHQLGGSFYLDVWLWNTNEGATWEGPRWWLQGSPIPATQADALSYPGDPGTGTVTRLVDGLNRGTMPMYKTLPQNQFTNPSTFGSAAYAGAWVWSPSAQSASLKLGATRKARVWVNGTLETDLDNSVRYANVDETVDPVLVHDEQTTTGISLNAGWNSLMVASDDNNGQNRTWVYSLKLEGASQSCQFHTRSMGLSSNGTTLSWSLPSHHNLSYDEIVIQTSTSRTFSGVSTYNAGLNTSVAIASLTTTPGVTNYVRAVPRNDAGELLLDVADVVEVEPGGDLSIPPIQSSPIATASTPQFVLFGSDDNNRAGGMEFMRTAFGGRLNPDGSQALMSFYIIGTNIYGPNISSNEWRDEYMAIYEANHELGNHGFHGLAGDAARGSEANWLNNWMQPTQDAIEQMFIAYGYTAQDATDAITGYRYAQDVLDQYGPDAVKTMGYLYQNSSVTNHSSNLPAYFPGTIENGWPGGATWDNRDFGDTTGIMEIPQTYEVGGSRYCDKNWFEGGLTGADWLVDMKEAFTELYNGNRAPFSLCLHSQDWGPTNTLAGGGVPNATLLERQQAFNDLLDWLLSGAFPDVRIVTHKQMYDWMLNPTALGSEPGSGQTLTMQAPAGVEVSAPAATIASVSAPDQIITADVTSVESVRPDNFLQTAASQWVWPATTGNYSGPADEALFIQGLKATDQTILRWGGGNWVNSTGWDRTNSYNEFSGVWSSFTDDDVNSPSFGQSRDYTHIYNAKMMDNLGTLTGLVPGLKIMLQINMMDNNPDMWLDLLRYCMAEGRNIPIDYIEMGNEQDLNDTYRLIPGGTHLQNAQEYSRRFVDRYAPIITTINSEKDAGMPTVKFGGPVLANPAQGNASSFDNWWPTFKSYCDTGGITPDFISWHYYASSFVSYVDEDRGPQAAAVMSYDKYLGGLGTAGTTVSDTNFAMVLKRKFAELQVDGINAEITGWENVEQFITENRPWSQNASETPHGKAVNVTWFLDTTQRMMRKGVGGVMWYTFRESNESAGALGGPSQVQVPFYGPYLLAKLTGKNNLPTTVSTTGYPGWASKDDDGNVYFSVGDDTGVASTVRLQLSGAAPGEYTQATVYKFEATGGYDVNLGTGGGALVSVNGTFQWSESTATTVEAKNQALIDSGVVSALPATVDHVFDITLEPFQQAFVVYGIAAPVTNQNLFMAAPAGMEVSAPTGGTIVSNIVTTQDLTMTAPASVEASAPAGSIAIQGMEVVEVAEAEGATVTFSATPNDDEMVILAAHQNTVDGTSIPSFTWPAGFTELRQSNGSAIAYKEASSEAGAGYTVSSSLVASDVSTAVDSSTEDAIDHTPGFLGYSDSGSLYTGISSGSGITAGLRFSVNIPAGANVTDARITLTKLGFDGGNHTATIGCEDSASPATFSSGTRPKLRTMTSATISDTLVDGGPNAEWQSASFHASVQEVIDTHGAITELVVLIDGSAASTYALWNSYDDDSAKAPQLDISLESQEMTVHGVRVAKGSNAWTIIGHSGATSTDTAEATPSVSSAGIDDFVAWGTAVSEHNENAWTGSNAFSGTASGGSDTEGGDVRSTTQADGKIKSTSATRVYTGGGTVIYTSKTSDSDRITALQVLVSEAANQTLVMSSPAGIDVSAPAGTIGHTQGLVMSAPAGMTLTVGPTGDYDSGVDYDAAVRYEVGGSQPSIELADVQTLTQPSAVGVDISAPVATIASVEQTLTMNAALSVEVSASAGSAIVTGQNLDGIAPAGVDVSAPAATIATTSAQTLVMAAPASVEASAPAATIDKRTARRGVGGTGRFYQRVSGSGRV